MIRYHVISGRYDRLACHGELCRLADALRLHGPPSEAWIAKNSYDNILRLVRNKTGINDGCVLACICARLWWAGFRSEIIDDYTDWFCDICKYNMYLSAYARHKLRDILLTETEISIRDVDAIVGIALLDYMI